MHKRSLISFIFLFTFWIVISGVIDVQHIIVGIILSISIVWFWRDFNPRLPSKLPFKALLLFGRSILMLIGYVIKANIDVAKILLFSHQSVTPIFLEYDLGVKTDWGRVFLATCITITPGTITIDFDPDTDIFTIHALTIETGVSLSYWRIVTEIEKLEKLLQRGETHGMDISGIHGPDSISTIKSDHRTDRH